MLVRGVLGIIASALIAGTAQATAVIAAGSGASNVIIPAGATAPTFYYSNICGPDNGTANTSCTPATVTLQGSGPAYYAWSSDGSACNKSLNANCVTAGTTWSFQASSSVAQSGTPRMYVVANGTTATAPTTTSQISSFTPIMNFQYAGTGINTFNTTWSAVCAKLTTAGFAIDSNCNPMVVGGGTVSEPLSPINIPLYLIADANGNGTIDAGEDVVAFNLYIASSIPIAATSVRGSEAGIYGFTTYPGDSKVYILTLSEDANIPASENVVGAQAAHFLYVTGPDITTSYDINTFLSIIDTTTHTPKGQSSDVIFNSDGTLAKNYIPNLTNGLSYYIRAGILDNAGNVGFFTNGLNDMTLLTTDDDDNGAHDHAAKPDQVVGLMSKNGNCVVATAAYGTPMAPQLKILRNFRDLILLRSSMGKRFVHWYYRTGPAFADFIRRSENLRALVRFALYPFIAFSFVALKIGFLNTCLLIGALVTAPFYLRRRRKVSQVLRADR